MIGVAVLAPRSTTRARLEALISARPGLRLALPPSPVAVTGDHVTGAGVEADVLLIDPGTRRAEAVLRALPRAPRQPPIVLLADAPVRASFARLLRAGVRAVLPRDAAAPEVAAGIEAVAAGLIALHPSAAMVPGTKAAGAPGRGARDATGTEPLTPRELEILAMMAEGLGNRTIAQHLGISTHTVKFHIAAILDKLSARSRTGAVTTGMRLGLLMV